MVIINIDMKQINVLFGLLIAVFCSSCGVSQFSKLSNYESLKVETPATVLVKADTVAVSFRERAQALALKETQHLGVIDPQMTLKTALETAVSKQRKNSKYVDEEVTITFSVEKSTGKVIETKKSVVSHEVTGFYVYAGGGISATKTINPLGKVGFGYDFSPRFSFGANFAYSEGRLGQHYAYQGQSVDGDVMVKLFKASSPVQFAIGGQAGFLRNTHLQSANFKVIQDDVLILDENVNSYYDGYNFKFGPKATFEVKASNRVSSKLYDLRIGAFAQYDMFNIKYGQTDATINQAGNCISVGVYVKWNIGRKILGL